MKFILLKIIRLYQMTLSLDHGWLRMVIPTGRICRFTPSCSDYTYEAVDRFGILRGLALGLRRISRCHPWGGSGIDEVPEKHSY